MEEYIIVSKQPSIVIVESSKISMRLDAGNYRQDYLINRDQIRHSAFGSKKLVELLVKPSFRGRGFPENPSGQDPVIKVRNITNYGITGPYDYVDATGISKSDRAWARKGDVLLTVTGLGSSGKADLFFFDKPMLVDGHVAILRCSSKCDAGFLKAFLSSSYGQKLSEQDTIGSTGQIELYGSYIDQFDIPYPDSKIQAYIGDKVRLAERCREEAEKVKQNAQNFLDEVLGLPPVDNLPQSKITWWVDANQVYPERLDPNYYQPKFLKAEELLIPLSSRFSTILVNAKYGASVPADYTKDGIPFIRGTDLLPNRIDVSDLHYLDASISHQVKNAKIKKGDVLLTRSGTVGIAAAVTEPLDDFAFGSFMIKLRFTEGLSPFYVAAFLNSPYGVLQIDRQKNGAVQQNINLEEIDRLLLPNLPFEKQEEVSYHWKKWNLLLDYSQSLMEQAVSDTEKLIEGKLEITEIASGEQKSLSWEDVEKEVMSRLSNYA